MRQLWQISRSRRCRCSQKDRQGSKEGRGIEAKGRNQEKGTKTKEGSQGEKRGKREERKEIKIRTCGFFVCRKAYIYSPKIGLALGHELCYAVNMFDV